MIAKIKRLKILLLFVVALTMSFTGKKVGCIILRDNHFTYRNQGKDVLVIFKENEHVEYHNEKRFFIKSDITWVSDCEYYLTIKETTLPRFPFKIGTKLHIEIFKVKGEKIYYKSTLAGKSWEGRLTKTKKLKE